jgi:hypothetical protein
MGSRFPDIFVLSKIPIASANDRIVSEHGYHEEAGILGLLIQDESSVVLAAFS